MLFLVLHHCMAVLEKKVKILIWVFFIWFWKCRGDRGFCSVECRYRQIFMDEEESLRQEKQCSMAAMKPTSASSSSSSSSAASNQRKGTRNRGSGFAYWDRENQLETKNWFLWVVFSVLPLGLFRNGLWCSLSFVFWCFLPRGQKDPTCFAPKHFICNSPRFWLLHHCLEQKPLRTVVGFCDS